MHPFLIFAVILIIIWTLSGVATWINKQQEAERRRRAAMQARQIPPPGMQPPYLQPPTMEPPPSYLQPRHISEGIAERFPEVLRPPAPLPPQPPRRHAPVPPRVAARPAVKLPPKVQRAPKKPKQRHQQAPVPVLEVDEAPRPALAAAPPVAPAQRPSTAAGSRADAVALSRWLRPATLRQQFILTELFQPPLALRDPDKRL